MTEEQYKKYDRLSKELKPIKSFLFWCGDKYKEPSVSKYGAKLFRRKKGISIGRKGYGAIESTEIELPRDLQSIIIKDIEAWVENKEKELSEI